MVSDVCLDVYLTGTLNLQSDHVLVTMSTYGLTDCDESHPGDVEIGLMERNGGLEVEVVQARGLTMKMGSKGPPGNDTDKTQTTRAAAG